MKRACSVGLRFGRGPGALGLWLALGASGCVGDANFDAHVRVAERARDAPAAADANDANDTSGVDDATASLDANVDLTSEDGIGVAVDALTHGRVVVLHERGARDETSGAPEAPRATRPRTAVGPIDLDLKGAALGDALRFIAKAGGFNAVVEGDLDNPVTIDLNHVDAYDAFVTLAEANGLEVDLERGIVVVGPPKSRSAATP